MNERPPDFDRIARAYRWLEYASLGTLLERTRECHIPRLRACRRALVLGDGDGRFTVRLLETAPNIHVEAVDLSGVMLALLRDRCANFADRLQTFQQDVRTFRPHGQPDVIITHFFLDCLSQAEIDSVVGRLSPTLAPGTLWVVSDFRIPAGFLSGPAWIYIRALYFAFRVLTGLRVTRLPDHGSALRRCGFTRIAVERKMFGVLTAEVWELGPD